jgi:hypothetical protein
VLTGLIIPQQAELAAILATTTAQRLVKRGAALYLLRDGTTSVLSVKKPRDAFAKACSLPVFTGEAAA